MPSSPSRRALLAVATLATLVAAPSPARAVAPGSPSARRALAATLAGDAHGAPRGVRRQCPDRMMETGGGRIATSATSAASTRRVLARWSARARRWMTGGPSLAVYVAVGVSGLRDLASRITTV